ncbi:MAG: hypothetical protein ACE5HD_11475 [Acidobacteriota bacterium]
MPNVKGSNLLSRQAFVIGKHGAAAWTTLLEQMPPADVKLLAPRILASAWYPMELYNRLDLAICQAFAAGNLVLCREIGAFSARRALSGTYRIYLKDGPTALLHRLSVLHAAFYDKGSMQVTPVDRGHCLIRNVYVPRSSRTNCLVASGFYQTVVEMSGGKNVRVTEGNCSANGAPVCLFNILWSPIADGPSG